MVDDEDESSELGSEDEEEGEVPEIQEISALEWFSSTLQKAYDLALAAEREREKGRKRLKQYHGNSTRTKRRFQLIGRELARKGFHSVKDWFQKTSAAPHCLDIEPDAIALLRQESEEPESENEIQPGVVESGLSEGENGSKTTIDSWAENQCCQEVIASMLQDLRNGKRPHDDSEDMQVDRALNMLNYKNFPALNVHWQH
ncbi:hypothetical protein BU17DRAFT_100798 [Hysterangium stoloniferum]|nr:hypothetical protein BU17DRAFT_100798 [Hysterangium stoloniferum]